ncbi:MAG TPA: GNAT family N-acetyltransferase [Oligoflexia bacterium]|nr:GNAT family N-acetyltransferase [Oligoflexia bacterium]HMP49894.1 GNAT family N-acetyltransferase [Oligoflexia bacterium]
MSTITYREADKDEDLEFGRTVHHSAYRDVVIRQFGSWDEPLQDVFFKEGWNRAPHKIVLLDDVPIGVLSIAIFLDHLFLSELQILPKYQGKGFGTAIARELMDYSKSLALPLRLQVLLENQAQHLYRRLGFEVVGTTDLHVKMEWK